MGADHSDLGAGIEKPLRFFCGLLIAAKDQHRLAFDIEGERKSRIRCHDQSSNSERRAIIQQSLFQGKPFAPLFLSRAGIMQPLFTTIFVEDNEWLDIKFGAVGMAGGIIALAALAAWLGLAHVCDPKARRAA